MPEGSSDSNGYLLWPLFDPLVNALGPESLLPTQHVWLYLVPAFGLYSRWVWAGDVRSPQQHWQSALAMACSSHPTPDDPSQRSRPCSTPQCVSAAVAQAGLVASITQGHAVRNAVLESVSRSSRMTHHDRLKTREEARSSVDYIEVLQPATLAQQLELSLTAMFERLDCVASSLVREISGTHSGPFFL